MPLFTLGQAAKATGRSKAGILEAIQSGRLSAKRDERNQWQIDPSELNRVYPLTVQLKADSEQEQTPLNDQALRHVEEKIDLLERLIAGLESERDDLRQRLDQSEEERRATQAKLTAPLTHQPNPEQKYPQLLHRRSRSYPITRPAASGGHLESGNDGLSRRKRSRKPRVDGSEAIDLRFIRTRITTSLG